MTISSMRLSKEKFAKRKERTLVFLGDSVWFLDQIDLKTNIKPIVLAPTNRNHGDQIHKRLSALSVIYKTGLNLISLFNCRPKSRDRVRVDEFSFHPRLEITMWTLKESTVAANNLLRRVSRHAPKGF